MKSLRTIQVLAKIGKIISSIIFVFCVVGFCLCVAGIVSLALGVELFKVGSVTIHGLIENESGMSMPVLYASMAVGIVFCAAEAVLSKFAEIYFKRELADGTPFTMRGAGELQRLGILTVVLPLAAVIVCSAGVAIVGQAYPELDKLSLEGFASVGLGVMLIVLSVFCRYGAELGGENAQA